MEHSPGWILDETRKECIKDAIKKKDLTQTVDPFIKTCEYLEFAAGIENNFHVIEYLMSFNYPVDHFEILFSAVEKKALKNLKFLHEKKHFPIDDNHNLFNAAASIDNNFEIMEYLKSHNCPIIHSNASGSAAEKGALNNLKWLLKHGFSMEDFQIFCSAIESGSLEVLKWLKEKNCRIDKGTIDLSLKKCSLETIEWLIEQGIQINPTNVFIGAAKHGCLDKMEWLLEKGNSIKNSNIFKAAAKHGSLEILKWLLRNKCIHLYRSCKKGLLKNKCPINDSQLLVAAAEFGSIEQMKWLLDNKCPIAM